MSENTHITITFEPEGRVITVLPNEYQKESLLEIALRHDVAIDHACGGVSACSTCHVHILEGDQSCSPLLEKEEDQLDKAPGLSTKSRLACQCYFDGSASLRVRIPTWNRNLVQEGKSS